MVISETYDLQEDPSSWAATLKVAQKKFFNTYGKLPNCLGLHEELRANWNAADSKSFRGDSNKS